MPDTTPTTVELTDDDRELIADALGHLHATAPLRRPELIGLAQRTGLFLTVDYDPDNDYE